MNDETRPRRANLRPGEVVVDLGSGGGLDVFLAAKKVGATGRAILATYDVNEGAASVKIYALKPATSGCCGPNCCS